MKVKTLVLGSLGTNCYILTNDKYALIIDPASDASVIKDACKDYIVEGILVTHHHFDHVLALEELEEYYHLKHNTFNEKHFTYEVISTPGHASDSLSFYFKDEKYLFSGDFIFYHTIGRCDLETSSIPDMINSLNKIKEYPDDLVVYPGHGKTTILGDEKARFSSYF